MAKSDDPGRWLDVLFDGGDREPVSIPPATESVHGSDRLTHDVSGPLWTRRLFDGKASTAGVPHLLIRRNGVDLEELPLGGLKARTVFGRHPAADIQLEAYRLAMFHLCLWSSDGEYRVENLDAESGTLLNGVRLPVGERVRLTDGDLIEIPGYHLCLRLQPRVRSSSGQGDHAADVPCADSRLARRRCPLSSDLLATADGPEVWCGGAIMLRVADVIDETHDVKTFRLVGDEPVRFRYLPGQYLNLLLTLDGGLVRRSYSMSSSPSRPFALDLTVKRVPGGRVSNWLCDTVKPGSHLTVQGPYGRFSCLRSPGDKLLFVGAGSGITPLMSMCRWIVDTAADVDVQLLASFRTPADIIYRGELEWLAQRDARVRIATTITSKSVDRAEWGGLTGRITRDMLAERVPDLPERRIFLCGPQDFMQSVAAILAQLGGDRERLHLESFGAERSGLLASPGGDLRALRGTRHQVRFVGSGITVETDEHLSLLDLAEAHGIGLPYSCRTGECGECEIKCRGSVRLSKDCQIDERARVAGFVYACSSFALSDLDLEC
ncbi:MAG: FAD-binding oxidoreductase [Methylotetracoccus sp.]